MGKQQNVYFFIALAAIGILAAVLIVLFVPDMSSTLIDTVPEYPPEISTGDSAEPLNVDSLYIDRTNVKRIVAALRRPSEYYSETKSVLSYSGGSGTYTHRKWVKNKMTRIDSGASNSQNVSMRYIFYGDSVFAWKPGASSYYKTYRGSFDEDDMQMMMSYEDIISANDEDIITASLTQYDGVSCIYAEVANPLLGYTERYWVSTSSGLLVYGQSLDRNKSLVYTITAVRTDVAPQNDDIFMLPGGKMPA